MPTTGLGASGGRVLKRANPGTIQDKLLVGYQGWFTCGGDGPPIGEGHHGWLHWINQPLAANGRPNTDLWPDTSAYDPSELYTIEGLAHRDGSPAKVFSSRDPRTVRRHFRWMAEHGVDGAFLQRFVSEVDKEHPGNNGPFGGTRRLRDEVAQRVREAAEGEGRVWSIMYDVSGVPPSTLLRILTQDFTHLLRDERIFASPAYLRERGRPVVALWGFGMSDSQISPQLVKEVFAALRAIAREEELRAVAREWAQSNNPKDWHEAGDGEIYIFAGVPSHWRTPGQGDAHADPAWAGVWLGADGEEGSVDALSPWSVGRFGNKDEVERWAAERWGPDAELVAAHNEKLELGGGAGRRVDYVPVVLPGGSGFNLSESKWAFNGIKRNGGRFLWSQIFHAKRLKGVKTVYGAMWDEYDEGTAFLPVIEKKRLLPESDTWPFLALDEDGYDLPSDWYMRIAGFAAEGLRSERLIHDSFPSKELQDYWSSRPRYEDEDTGSATAGGSGSRSAGYGGASSQSSYAAPAPAPVAVVTPIPPIQVEKNDEPETEAAREAKKQFDIWAEEQRKKEAEKDEAPPPAYSLEDDVPVVAAPVQQAPVPVQQRPVENVQQPVVQSQLQQYNSYANGGNAAAVDALATEFAARTHIAPPLHPAHPGRRSRASSPSRQGSGNVGGANLGSERPPLHPAQQRTGSQGSGSGYGAGNGDGMNSGRPPLHPSRAGSSQGSVPTVGSAGGRVASPEVQGQGQGQWRARPPQAAQQQQQNVAGQGHPHHHQQAAQQQGYQQAQHTGGSAGSSASGPAYPPRPGQGSGYTPPAGAPPQGQGYAGYAPPAGPPQGHAGYAAPSGPPQGHGQAGYVPPSAPPGQAGYAPPAGPPGQSGYAPPAGPPGQSGYTPPAGPPQGQGHTPHAPQGPHHQYSQSQSPQHTGGSGSNSSASYPASPHQQHAYQQQQHTGGSGSSTSAYPPPQPPRPSSAYPGQAAATGYTPPAGPPPQGYSAQASSSGLGHSSSLSARPTYPGAASPPQGLSPRPDSAPRPTTPGYASYPAAGGGGAYPASPPPLPHGHPPSLAPRHDSVRPTTPGYAGQPHAGPGPMSPPPQAPYSNQFPSPNGPPPASYPGSSYNPPLKLPSPEIAGPAFPAGPVASPYGAYTSPPQSPTFHGQTFPSPQQGGYASPPPLGSPPYPPAGPSFPQAGGPGYFYQQPQPFDAGYSEQGQPYNNYNNYPQQPGQWGPGGPQMPYQQGSQPQPGYYGQQPYGAPGFPMASPPPSNYGLDPLDKIVGRKTREQLEGAVGSLQQSSTKLLNKFR
ncbi:hypothetical protein K438DRAFT_1957026 [Mycena galopus ATCC 62051]|nr:hypothetical protein K438DRAFT_1957026 [Mycena galopus ATCC 62051]